MSGRLVLVLDDEEAAFDLVSQCLGKSSYDYIFVSSVEDALEQVCARAGEIALIFADFYGPRQSHFALGLIPRVRELGYKVPIIVMSQLNPDRSDVALVPARMPPERSQQHRRRRDLG